MVTKLHTYTQDTHSHIHSYTERLSHTDPHRTSAHTDSYMRRHRTCTHSQTHTQRHTYLGHQPTQTQDTHAQIHGYTERLSHTDPQRTSTQKDTGMKIHRYTHTHIHCHKRGFDMSSVVFYHLLPKRPSQKGTSTFIEGFVCRENCVDFSLAPWLRENTLTTIKSANLHSKKAIGGVLDASWSYTRQPAHMQKSSSSHRIVFRGIGTYYLIMLLLPSQSSLMGLRALVTTEQEPRHRTHVNSADRPILFGAIKK